MLDVTVHATRAAVHHAPHARRERAFENMSGAVHVDARIRRVALPRLAIRRRDVVDDVAALRCRGYCRGIRKICDAHVRSGLFQPGGARLARRPNEHGHTLTRLQEVTRKVTASESRGARDENVHAGGTAGMRARRPAAVRRSHTSRVRETYISRL